MSIVIGLTGPTGSGKSSACTAAEMLGIKVVDCDLLARKAVEPGTPGLAALVEAFGEEILNTDGTLNRKIMAEKAFSSSENTELLNRTLLPFIAEMVKKEAQGQNTLLDAPTLFESGADAICDDTVAVLADPEIRLKRIISRDGMTKDAARMRMSAGKADSFYKENTGHILYNNGDKAEFINIATQLFKKLFGGNL